jgi:hypothetical protein
MVRAILDGRKTQTRRVMKPQPTIDGMWHCLPKYSASSELAFRDGAPYFGSCPYGRPGDRLWVRETWAQPAALDPGPTVYRADYPTCVPVAFENIPPADAITWKPSIHMPRALCRLVLEVTGVRVERLNDCTQADAIAEGIERDGDGWLSYAGGSCVEFPTTSYASLWDSINGADAWDANPWVWVVEFRRV